MCFPSIQVSPHANRHHLLKSPIWAQLSKVILIALAIAQVPSSAKADNAREIVGKWEAQQIKAGVVTAKLKSDKPREFFEDGRVVDHGGKQQTGTYRFIDDKTIEITLDGKTEKLAIRILNKSMVTTGHDGTMKVEIKWKRVD